METTFVNRGYLSIYHGCMFAGKTRRLIMKLSKKQDLGMKSCYITHGDDERLVKGSNCGIGTHWSCFQGAIIPFDCYKTFDLKSLDLSSYDVIGIDEFQFFSFDAVSAVVDLVENQNKIIYVAGLDTNFRRDKFGHIFDLLPYCDKSKKIKAKCMKCGLVSGKLTPAIFSAKIAGNPNEIRESGGSDKYISVCRHHYLEYRYLIPIF